jgi:hypothetical protein
MDKLYMLNMALENRYGVLEQSMMDLGKMVGCMAKAK